MAITGIPYPTLGVKLLTGGIVVGTDTFKVSLHTSAYTPDLDHDFFSDVTNEVSGTGYTAGGVTLTGGAATYDATNNRTYLDFADPTWATATVTFRYAVWRKDTGSSATSPLLCYTDFGADQVYTASTVLLTIDPTGLLRIA